MFHHTCQICRQLTREEELVRYGDGFACQECLAKRNFAPKLSGLSRLKLGRRGSAYRPQAVGDILPGWLTHPEPRR
jgi:hypothetical protein